MIIDSHGHVTAPDSLYVYKAQILAHRGKDLVYVSFELVSYSDAVRRKREGVSLECS